MDMEEDTNAILKGIAEEIKYAQGAAVNTWRSTTKETRISSDIMAPREESVNAF